jgi:hypothetical protein
MRNIVIGFDLCAWLAAAASVLAGHGTVLVLTRPADAAVVAASQHPGEWMLSRVGAAAAIMRIVTQSVADSESERATDYRSSVGVVTDHKILSFRDWVATATAADVMALNRQHTQRTRRGPLFSGLCEPIVTSRSYISHFPPDESAAALMYWVRKRATVVFVRDVVADATCVRGRNIALPYDGYLVICERPGTVDLSECRVTQPPSLRAITYLCATPTTYTPYGVIVPTQTRRVALITMESGDLTRFWTYLARNEQENRLDVSTDVVDFCCSEQVYVKHTTTSFGGFVEPPEWTIYDHMIPIGFQAHGGPSHTTDAAITDLSGQLGYEWEIPSDYDDDDDDDQ